MPVERQVVVIYAGVNGLLDKIPVNRLREYEEKLAKFIDNKRPGIYKDIVGKGKIDDELKAQMNQAIEDFGKEFGV